MVSKKDLSFKNDWYWLLWLYFGIQYVIPGFLALPFVEQVYCTPSCGDAPHNILTFFFLISFVFVAAHFPRDVKKATKLFVPLVVNFALFILLFGFDSLRNDLAIFGIIHITATFIAFALWMSADIPKKLKKASRTKHPWNARISAFFYPTIVYAMMIHFVYSLFFIVQPPDDIHVIVFYAYIMFSIVEVILSLRKHLGRT